MAIIIGGFTQYTGNEYTVYTHEALNEASKGLAGRVVKLSTDGKYVEKITANTDMPYGVVVGEVGGVTQNLSLSQTICVRGRNIYVELDPAVTSITAGTPAYINADGQFTDDDAGSFVGVFTSNVIINYNSKKVALAKVG